MPFLTCIRSLSSHRHLPHKVYCLWTKQLLQLILLALTPLEKAFQISHLLFWKPGSSISRPYYLSHCYVQFHLIHLRAKLLILNVNFVRKIQHRLIHHAHQRQHGKLLKLCYLNWLIIIHIDMHLPCGLFGRYLKQSQC